MAHSRTIEAEQHLQSTMPLDTGDDAGFGAEFRELARQRRFVRSTEDRPSLESEFWDAAPPKRSPRRAAAPAAPAAPAPAPAPAPVAPAPMPAPPAAATPAPPAPVPAHAAPPASRMRAPRISEDQRATLLELARMSDRLVQSREALVVATTRAEHLATELDAAHAGLSAANDRLMASQVLVQDAQRTTRELAERSAWLEGRIEMLQEALELAVNASVVTRWKWRREQRARARANG